MKAQPSIKQYPVAIFKLAAVFFVLLPLLVTSVIFCQRHFKIDPFYLKNGEVKLTPLISY